MAAARQIAKRMVRTGLHGMGGLNAIVWWTRRDFRILTYHRFPSQLQDELDRQCAFLKRHFRIVPLPEIAAALKSGAHVPSNTLAITIDDGYRDILTSAFPVFEKWKIPAAVYLISGFLDCEFWPWWDKVSYAVERTRKDSVCIEENGSQHRIPLRTASEKDAAIETIRERVKRFPNPDLQPYFANLNNMFEVEIPAQAPPESAPLSWAEVRRLADAGITFGAHTKTHPILPKLDNEAEIREEIAGSKARIEQELGRAVEHFCYPNGDRDDLSEAIVKSSGFATAVVTESGLNRRGADPYRLKRLSVEPGLARDYYREQVVGLHAVAVK